MLRRVLLVVPLNGRARALVGVTERQQTQTRLGCEASATSRQQLWDSFLRGSYLVFTCTAVGGVGGEVGWGSVLANDDERSIVATWDAWVHGRVGFYKTLSNRQAHDQGREKNAAHATCTHTGVHTHTTHATTVCDTTGGLF